MTDKIVATYRGHPVEVTGGYPLKNDDILAVCELKDGTTVPVFTSDGWGPSNEIHVPVSCLHDWKRVQDEDDAAWADHLAWVQECEEMRMQA